MKPTIYVTNWSSRNLHGPGRKWTIMARPRAWERGDGMVPMLVPSAADMTAARRREITPTDYLERYLAGVGDLGELAPGRLHGGNAPWAGEPICDGDTLCCACARAEALAGRCHRVWAAELLRRAGWRVVLDGKELAGVTEDWRPVFVGEAP